MASTSGSMVSTSGSMVSIGVLMVDSRLNGFDKQFEFVTETFVELRKYIEFGYTSLENTMNGRFDRLERKIDQVIVVRRRPKRR